MSLRDLYVRPGDLVLPAVNSIKALQKTLRIIGGRGILLGRSPSGVRINARALVQGFTGYFAVVRNGSAVSVGEGYVNGLLPLIDGVPILGTEKKPVPKLKLSTETFNDSGRSWISIRAKVDPDSGRIIQPDENGKGELELSIVQRASNSATDPDDDTIGYHAIAMLKRLAKEKKSLGELRQIAYFDYQHRTGRDGDRFRHYFDPA